jgi:purine catabolism regulator
MNLTIKDVLQLFQEQSMHLAAGTAGIANIVHSVNIMDAPDIWNWVKPGDLILTTAFSVKNDSSLQEELIRNLASAGCSGLGIKTKRFLPEIPPLMREIADELGFPILELPLDLSLAEIMNPIVSSIATRQSYLLQRSNEIHKTLTNVAIQGGGLTAIITCLGKLTHCAVGCYDTDGVLISHWLPEIIPGHKPDILPPLEQRLKSKVAQSDSFRNHLSQAKNPYTQPIIVQDTEFLWTSFVIMSSKEFFGHISIYQPSYAFIDINCIALEHACTIAALDFLKNKAISESRRLHSRDLVEHILFGNLDRQVTAEIITASKLPQSKFFKCLVIELDHNKTEVHRPVISNRLYKIAQQIITAKYPSSLVSERTGRIIALLAATFSFDEEEEIYNKLQSSFNQLYSNLKISIGVGTLASSIPSIRQSYQDALICLTLGREIKGSGHIIHPHEVAIYSILSTPHVSTTLANICAPLIAKLEKADKNSGMDLLKTLEKYLECDKNLTETAKELFIHRNTLTNRLDRIVDILKLDLQNRELLFCMRLALRQRKSLPLTGSSLLR